MEQLAIVLTAFFIVIMFFVLVIFLKIFFDIDLVNGSERFLKKEEKDPEEDEHSTNLGV